MNKKISRRGILQILLIVYLVIGNFFNASSLNSLLLLVIVFLMVLVDFSKRRTKIGKISINGFIINIFLFVVVCFLSIQIAVNKDYAIAMTMSLAKIALTTFVMYNVYKNNFDRDMFFKAIMWTGYVLMAIMFVYYGPSTMLDIISSEGERLSSDLINSNVLGMSIAFSTIINIFYGLNFKFEKYSILILPSIIVIAASGSRKTLLTLIIGIIGILYLKSKQDKFSVKKILKILVFLILASVIVYIIIQSNIFNNLSSRIGEMFAGFIGKGEVDRSTNIRMLYTQLGLEIFKAHPILGVGIDNARIFTYQISGFNHYLHNNFAELLADVGMIGFVVYYLMYLTIFIKNFILYKKGNTRAGLILVMLVLMVIMDYGRVSYYSKETYLYLMGFSIYGMKGDTINENN